MSIGENIKKYRKKAGMTQIKLGKNIGKSESTIQKYESNSVVPNIEILKEIAEALGVTVYDLIDEKQINTHAIADNSDMVNHPSHYTSGKYECIDIIEDVTKDLQGIEAVCTGNAIKYLWRWKLKNGVENLKKAKWYIDKLIERKEDINNE